jgi:signal transduction histidine kinase
MQLEAVRGEAEATIGKLASEAKVHLDAKMRLRASLAATEDYSRKALVAQRKSTEDALTGAEKYVKSELSNARIILQETKDEIDNAIAEFEFEGSDEEKLESFRTSLERKLVGARKQFEERLDIIRARLDRVRSHDDEDDILSDEAVAALETQLEVLKDDYAQTLELAQLGMAVSIVQHEFEANVRGVRRSLRSMQKWANRNEGLRELYEDIRDGFDHLDNYLSLFTPLDRRLRRRKTQISGEQIGEFLRDLFGERFTRHSIQFTLTKTAADHHLESYASVILPVFVNLIDNSIYWLSKKDGAREITLDAHDETFVLSDNGPGISELDKEFIFEFGYSKKYGGQGMGLYIAKTSLNKEDLDIRLVSNFKSGAKFEIGPMEAAS